MSRIALTLSDTALADLKKDFDAAASVDGKAAGWGVGYEHAFSKRTTGYAAVSRISHDDFVSKDKSFGGVQYDKDASVNSFAIGMRHTF